MHFSGAEQTDETESSVLHAQRQLDLICRRDSAGMEQRQQLDSVLRLHVMNAVSEHFNQRVENAPSLRFRDARHHLCDETFDTYEFKMHKIDQLSGQ